jgi:putative FmdB family regulatory protein
MPIYTFKCKSCKNEFDELVFNNKTNTIKCKYCSDQNAERIFSSSNTVSIFKGNGFYTTDYKK